MIYMKKAPDKEDAQLMSKGNRLCIALKAWEGGESKDNLNENASQKMQV